MANGGQSRVPDMNKLAKTSSQSKACGLHKRKMTLRSDLELSRQFRMRELYLVAALCLSTSDTPTPFFSNYLRQEQGGISLHTWVRLKED